jgi:hypothetical protein
MNKRPLYAIGRFYGYYAKLDFVNDPMGTVYILSKNGLARGW